MDNFDNKNNVSKNNNIKNSMSPNLMNPRMMSMHQKDNGFANKLQNINTKNRIIPPIGGYSFNSSTSETSEEEQINQEEIRQEVEQNIKNEVRSETTKYVIKEVLKKIPLKWKIIIIAAISFIVLILLITFSALMGTSDENIINSSSVSYVNGAINDDELIKQLQFYGFCNSESDCKRKGIYKLFKKLKSTYNDYNKSCTNPSINSPCGIPVNTALIIETMNYYQNEGDSLSFNDVEETTENKSFFDNLIAKFINWKKEKNEFSDMLNDVDKLANAQAEYVKEICVTTDENGNETRTISYFYQISFNKYISYLNYGETSTHPNYHNEPVEVYSCSGPQNDYIATSYETNTPSTIYDYTTNSSGQITSISGEGMGVDIVNFALKYVGHPYVWGGTNLETGVDCSGFTMKVFEQFGIKLPHSAKMQGSAAGSTLISSDINDIDSKALPGDLIVWRGHVAIYMGNHQIVHASTPKTGIIVSSNIQAEYPFIGIVRYWK